MARKSKEESFGAKLRALREQEGLTLDELAARVNLKASYLAELESDRTLPHVAEILTISRNLAVEPSSFLETEAGHGRRATDHARRTDDYAYETLTPHDPRLHLMAFRVSIDPESEHRKVGYRHEGEECIYVIEGRLELRFGTKSRTLGPGEAVSFDSGQKHHLRNPGRTPTLLLVVIYSP
jgi:transcriptional regulator with XRE-family HTH domain